MKKLIQYFTKYHVAVNVVIFAFALFGYLGFKSLKSSFFPLTESHIVTIAVNYPGASPLEIEEGVVLKIEDNLKGLQGVERVTSVSRENSGSIVVEVEKERNIDFMLLEVKNAVDRVPSFPTGMEPLVVAKQEVVRPTISFGLSGNIPLKNLKDIARQIENDLRAIKGISQISVSGFPAEEIEIAVQESQLLAYNLSFAEVAQAVGSSNLLVTGGQLKTDAEEFLIRANNKKYYADELSQAVIKTFSDGRIVYLKDIATVRDRFSETPNATLINGNLAVEVSISSTNSEDLLSTAEIVKQYIADFNASHDALTLTVLSDQSITLNQRTELLLTNAFQGMLLVLIFLSLFLNTRLAFWVAFGLPISFLGMFALAPLFGVTINVLSLFGMIIVIGILVDDGIVIAENIYQKYEEGKKPMQAALEGTLEVIPPIVSAIITTVLAFSLFLFLDSRIGEFFGEVSVIVILTLLVSLLEALLILPAHLAHSKALQPLDKNAAKGVGAVFAQLRSVNKVGDKLMGVMRDQWYVPFLTFSLRHRLLVFSLFVAAVILTFGSIGGGVVKTAFFPNVASDQVQITLTMPNGTNERITDSIISMIEERAWEADGLLTEEYLAGTDKKLFENIVKQIGPGSSRAELEINLLPGENRPDAVVSEVVTKKIAELVGPVIGVESLVYGSGGNFGGSPVSISLLGNNIAELKAAKAELKSAMLENSSLKDVEDNDPAGIKEVTIRLKENAYALGLNYRTLMDQVRGGFFGAQAQRFQRGQDEIRVWVRYERQDRSSLTNLEQMRILTPSGARVPLSEVASYEIARGDVAINHLEGRREIRLSADLKDPKATTATEATEMIKSEVLPQILAKYPSVTPSYEGQNREADKLLTSLNAAGIPILVMIYITIAFTFRSMTQPLLLFIMVPLSLTAVAWGHWMHGFPLNVLSILGIIALIGIMVNDGLVFIGKFNTNLKTGLKFEEALLDAGKSRFRAIFLTSATTISGLAPLIFEKSRQAQFLKPMAISIAYGIGYATLLTLIVLPILLSFNNQLKVWVSWLKSGDMPSQESVEQAILEEAEEKELIDPSDEK
ncbi:MAG: efflux RND transporter permease subunit [Flavobacteriaceae bacterium]|nr:efflux RND transporter permease subunit [Flavobacteriaceae bacterium]MDP4755157.1 efflux RND transporter permease subunit [Flavobacteriaceae bacterium]MDP4794888.1 efflux RND transporter permease subunit [Flavobacteriaceae bacterium]MDP4885976.1 efflux RND transporter permease subunit [Flavobacteriaceae bacterium]MDP4971734.1 efflux RND transporter permease subunit [Flavobacteriaceae bacterium]